MNKPLLVCMALFIMSGCASLNKTQTNEAKEKPAGLIQMLKDGDGGTYADMRVVSTYQDNPHLRQIYLINNYAKDFTFQQDPPIKIRSSRVINVFNCDKHERAQFERIYFTQRWAEGDKVFKRDTVGQWQPYPTESLIGIIATGVCEISPAHLKPEPPADTQTPLL
ncbi:surface-adhesin E family protein [Salmonella enterica]